MESRKLLSKIKSTYILERIFTYIEDNKFKLKLFTFSKSFQKKLNIELYNYQEIYFKKYDLNLNIFLNLSSFDLAKRTLLRDRLNNLLIEKNIDMDSIKSYVINYYKYKSKEEIMKEENLKFNSKLLIDISSPFLEILSQTDLLEQYFTITIPINYFNTYGNIKKDYISCFDQLNKTKAKYYSIKIDFKDNEDINVIKELNINFEQVKELGIFKIGRTVIDNYNYFLSNLFNMKSIVNNLKFLYINIYDTYNSIILEPNSLEGLNNFENLEILKLHYFVINGFFTLKLYNLKELELKRCVNIIFGENLNLKNLILIDCNYYPKLKSLTILPELESYELTLTNIDYIQYKTIFDFSKFFKLKKIKCEFSEFLHLNDNLLIEKVKLISRKNSSKAFEEKILKKITNFKKLREISLKLSNINSIKFPKEKSTSILKLKLFLESNNYPLYNLLDMFINLQEIEILCPERENYKYNIKIKIKIIQNPKSKIEKITIEGRDKNIELYCSSFENLKYIKLRKRNCTFIDLKDTLPVFTNNCNVIFKSLNYFLFYPGEMNFTDFDNLNKNIDKLPNLKHFSFDSIVNNMNKKYYEDFIRKLLSMKLDVINLTMKIKNQEENEDEDFDNNCFYSEKELKEIYPGMERDKHYSISKIINLAYIRGPIRINKK